jgi:hypothetical protein
VTPAAGGAAGRSRPSGVAPGRASPTGAGCSPGVIAQPASIPRIAAPIAAPTRPAAMWLILLEALGALLLLVFIVWWTMFSGRRRGERRDDE